MNRRTVLLGAAGGWFLPTRSAGAPDWDPAVLRFVSDAQEREYVRLADALKLGSAKAAYERIVRRPMAPDLQQRYASASVPPWEDPYLSAVMTTTYDVLKREVDALGAAPLPRAFLATLPSGDVDARTRIERTTKTPVVFFEHGLFSMFKDLADLMAWAVPPLSLEQLADDSALAQIPRRYTMPMQASANFSGTFYAYVMSGSSIAEPSPLPSPTHNLPIAILLLNHMERFVMVHEMMHLRNSDFDKDQQPDMEYQADALSLGLITTLARVNHGSWAVGYWAAELALVALNLLYRCIGLFTYGPEKLTWINKTHPDPLARRDRLRGIWLDRRAPPEGVAAARELVGMSDALIQRLWEISLPIWMLNYQRGARTSPRWKNTANYIQAAGGGGRQ